MIQINHIKLIEREEKMNQEKLKEIHSKRFLDSSYKEVNFEDQNNLQFFISKKKINEKIILLENVLQINLLIIGGFIDLKT